MLIRLKYLSIKKNILVAFNVDMHLVGDLDYQPFPETLAKRVKKVGLVPHAELPTLLARFDISLAPLCPGAFNDCKSAIKFIEASLVGIPTVASPTPAFVNTIENGKTGFLAHNADEWEQYLERLIGNPELRETLGRAASDVCQEDYSPIAWHRIFSDIRRGFDIDKSVRRGGTCH